MKESFGEFCARTEQSELLKQWHPSKNLPLTPDAIISTSHKAVWWMCGKKHEWRAQVRTRTEGTGCPVCANRIVLPGENDLATLFPELAAQWHPTLNGGLTPSQIVPGNEKKVWWRCKLGHQWQAQIASRARDGKGCPYCAGKLVLPGFNDLATLKSEVAEQWHPTLNKDLTPDKVTAYSNRKVWWLCERGHAYQADIGHRSLKGSGCPYCAGRLVWPGFNDLATAYPDIAAQWHPTLNNGLTAQMVTPGSRKRVWWQCELGHVWQAVVYSRTGKRQCGCPVCAGRTSRFKPRYDGVMEGEVHPRSLSPPASLRSAAPSSEGA